MARVGLLLLSRQRHLRVDRLSVPLPGAASVRRGAVGRQSIGGPIVRDRAHIFIALDRWNSNEPLFSGLVQTSADEVASGVARDSLTRLIHMLGTNIRARHDRAPRSGVSIAEPVANTAFARIGLVARWPESVDAHRATSTSGTAP